ncbi:DUF4367 domain-containing protein [Chloroflexia bacterium SDU3-3]|nr:DUF4367 domain-containing protein [Chloroflexia bacterium SDU3-3]
MKIISTTLIVLCCTILAGCSSTTRSTPTVAPTTVPTIAEALLAPEKGPLATATPRLQVVPSQPTAIPGSTPSPATSAFVYLWPAYLPDGMYVSPSESRVPHANEMGSTSTGFYIVTFNSDTRKIIVGGGATDSLVLNGESRSVEYDGEMATLTTDGEQREFVFIKNKVKYFIYSRNISEQELILVAESMVPNELTAIQNIVAGKEQ